MNVSLFYRLAQEAGIEQFQIQVSQSKATSVRLFRGQIDSYKISDDFSLIAAGIYKGKFGMGTTSKRGKEGFAFLVSEIIRTATYNEKEGEASLFEGSPKYKKGSFFNKGLSAIPMKEKIDLLFSLEKTLLSASPYIVDTEGIGYAERESHSEFHNSHGVHLSQKRNYYSLYAYVVGKKDEETKSFGDVFFDNDYSKFDAEKFTSGIVKGLLSKFGGKPIKAKAYPTLLDRDVFSDLVGYFLSACSADEVMRHSSFLEGKLGEQVASKKFSIEERPLEKNIYFTYFDDEGHACLNKKVVEKGKLLTYFHNRETAKHFGVESTGNGSWVGGRIGVGSNFCRVKGGKKSKEELIAHIKEGVYITEIAGLGTGMNEASGDFSCQAEGYLIEDGKITKPLNLITLSGNILGMLKDLVGIDKESKLTGGLEVGDALIKKMNIGGLESA